MRTLIIATLLAAVAVTPAVVLSRTASPVEKAPAVQKCTGPMAPGSSC